MGVVNSVTGSSKELAFKSRVVVIVPLDNSVVIA